MTSLYDFPSAGHFLMHCDAFHHQNSDPPPALPVRSLRKVKPFMTDLIPTALYQIFGSSSIFGGLAACFGSGQSYAQVFSVTPGQKQCVSFI